MCPASYLSSTLFHICKLSLDAVSVFWHSSEHHNSAQWAEGTERSDCYHRKPRQDLRSVTWTLRKVGHRKTALLWWCNLIMCFASNDFQNDLCHDGVQGVDSVADRLTQIGGRDEEAAFNNTLFKQYKKGQASRQWSKTTGLHWKIKYRQAGQRQTEPGNLSKMWIHREVTGKWDTGNR